MPPIPEDAVVIADYMLMADFVKQTDCEVTQISKGVRYCSASRDHFCDGTAAFAANVDVSPANTQWGLRGGSTNVSSTNFWKLPFFGTTGLSLVEQSHNISSGHTVELGGSATTETALDNSTLDQNDMISITDVVTLGATSLKTTLKAGQFHCYGHLVATPIHTSSHYQTFETPFLHELVGGDRNMEQTNLVVTPDGKTWDEVTRDVSYIGNCVLVAEADGASYTPASAGIFDEWRGKTNERNLFNKDFAIAYDRQICLRDGQYIVAYRTHIDSAITGDQWGYIKVNGGNAVAFYNVDANYSNVGSEAIVQLKRGDYIQIFSMLTAHSEAFYHIYRL